MTPTFFRKWLHIVGESITAVVLQALNCGKFSYSLNHTFITLIPKKKKLDRIIDFTTVSQCNVIYKVILRCWLISLSLFFSL